MPIIMKDGIAYSSGSQTQEMKLAEYLALDGSEISDDTIYFITDANEEIAKTIVYDNTNSGLEATNIQDAIDEISSKGGGNMQDLYYGSLVEREALANAITNKGIHTNTSDTLSTMAENISEIYTDGEYDLIRNFSTDLWPSTTGTMNTAMFKGSFSGQTKLIDVSKFNTLKVRGTIKDYSGFYPSGSISISTDGGSSWIDVYKYNSSNKNTYWDISYDIREINELYVKVTANQDNNCTCIYTSIALCI